QFPVELRDLDTAVIDRMWRRIQERFKQIDHEENVETSCTPLDDVEHAAADPAVKSAIYAAAKSLGLATMDLPSGAVQDAQRSPRSPHGHDFRPQPRRHKPLTQGIHLLA